MSKLNLITVCKTLKKEGRAFRNIGNKKYIFPTAKSINQKGGELVRNCSTPPSGWLNKKRNSIN